MQRQIQTSCCKRQRGGFRPRCFVRAALKMVGREEEEGQVPSNFRVIRFDAQPEVVQRILEKDGSIYIGKDKGTVYYKSKPLTKGTQVNYKLQK